MRNSLSRWAAAAALAAAGCGGDPRFGDVVGTVTLDGRPVEHGAVRFEPIDGRTASANAFIEGGRFALLVPVAAHKVQVSATGLRPARPGEEAAAYELVPARYNEKSELTVEVKRGANRLDLDLSSP